MGFNQLLAVLKARRMLLGGVWAAVVLFALVVSLLLPKQYSAQAEVVVEPRGSDPLSAQHGSGFTTPGFLATQADIIDSERVGARAVTLLGLPAKAPWAEKWQKAAGGQGDAARWNSDRRAWACSRLLRRTLVCSSNQAAYSRAGSTLSCRSVSR